METARAWKSEANGWSDNRLPALASDQADCDAILEAARQSGPAPISSPEAKAPEPLEATDDIIEFRLAEELEYAQQLLEVVGDRFVSDPHILQRHQTTMQSFDIIGQILGHLAKVVGAQDKQEAIDRIGMHELRARLKRPTAGIVPAGTIGSLRRSS